MDSVARLKVADVGLLQPADIPIPAAVEARFAARWTRRCNPTRYSPRRLRVRIARSVSRSSRHSRRRRYVSAAAVSVA